MLDKKIIYPVSIIITILSFILTVICKEENWYHIFYHLFLLVIILLALFISMKTVFNLIMVFSAFIWALTFFDILTMVPQLLFETLVMIFSGLLLGFYEFSFKGEKAKFENIISYKKEENRKIEKNINELNSINENLLSEIKEIKKKLTF